MGQVQNIEKKAGQATGFKKDVGLFSGISLIGGIIIGSGIFYSGAIVLQRTNMSVGLSLICWLIGGIIALLGSLAFAELGAEFPETGGEVIYLRKAYHPGVGFSFGFTMLLAGMSASLAALCVALPTAFKSFVNIDDTTIKIIAYVLIIGLTVYNLFGIKIGAIIGNVAMVAKLIPLVLIVVVGIVAGTHLPNLSLITAGSDGQPASLAATLSMIGFGVISVFWAYDGWENLGTVAGEMKRPQRDLPRALIIVAIGCTALYMLFNFAISRVLSADQISSFIAAGTLYLGTEVAQVMFGGVGAGLVLVCMVVSIFSCLNAEVMAFPRNYYAMAEGGHFFKAFLRVNKRGVPHVAMIVQCAVVIVLISIGNLSQLTSMCVFTTMIYNTLTIIGVIMCRRKYPTKERPFKVWLYPVLIIVNVVIYVALMVNTFITDPVTAVIGLAIPVVSIFVFLIFDHRLKTQGGTPAPSEDTDSAEIGGRRNRPTPRQPINGFRAASGQ